MLAYLCYAIIINSNSSCFYWRDELEVGKVPYIMQGLFMQPTNVLAWLDNLWVCAFANKKEQSQTAYLRQGEFGPYPEHSKAAFGSGWLPNFNRDFLGQSYICRKIFMMISSVLPETWAKCWKNAVSHNVEESFKKFLDSDPEGMTSKMSSVLSYP